MTLRHGPGRPSLPEDERRVVKCYRFNPDLVERIKSALGSGEKESALVVEAVEKEVSRRERQSKRKT